MEISIRLRRDLLQPAPPPAWPRGVRPEGFRPVDAGELHAALVVGYAGGGGEVAPFEVWREALFSDAEFDPALCFLVRDDAGSVIGAAQCWTSAFLKDLVVHPAWRRRGLGAALLLQVFGTFRSRGAETVDLKVLADNASAIRLYLRLGMTVVDTVPP
jgi:ribosomal protein S18 acetylase RimI-like enzyme